MANIFAPQALPSSPTSQQTTTGGLNAWAQPYVTDLLKQAQGLSADPTALQQQSYQNVSNLGVAPQIGQATGMATGAAQGAMGTAGNALGYGQQGAGYGQQATQAGQNYANMATDPNSIQAYMSPYIQQSLAPQLAMLGQQQAIASQGINAKAVGQGAFGGNRATLAQGLNAQNYDLARQQAIGQGYDTAFKQAQQAQQFGSNLGLQGLGVGIQGAQAGLQGVTGAQNAYGLGLQGASTLGQLGQNQFNQQATAAQLQNQLGTQQYLMPQQLLQTKQNMLQGLPVGSSMTQGWQSGPNSLSQGIGAVGALGTLFAGGANSAFNTVRSMFPGSSGGGGGSNTYVPGGGGAPNTYIPNEDPTMDNRDFGGGGGNDFASTGEDWAQGGTIKGYAQGGMVQSYASGGISSINNAVRNDPTAYSEQTINGGVQHNILGDITKLIAMNDIAKERNAMLNQQAMQAPTPSGSVAQQLAAQLQQQRQQMQQPQMPQQMAQMASPQGIDNARSNLPQVYAGGGIIAFEEGGTAKPTERPTSIFDRFLGSIGLDQDAAREKYLQNLAAQQNFEQVTRGQPGLFEPTTQAQREKAAADLAAAAARRADINVKAAGPTSEATPVPVAPVATKPDSGIVIHPNAPRVAAGPSGPSVAMQAASAPAYTPTDTSGITDLLKGYADKITGSEDFGQSRQDANISALRKLFLGMAAGKSPYFFSNVGDAGIAAQESLDKTLEGIQARKNAQLTQLMGLGLKGEELKNAAKKLGIDEAELKAKLPYLAVETEYKKAASAKELAMAKYYGTKGSGVGGITAGTIPFKDLIALKKETENLIVNPKSDPAFYASLGKRVQDLLSGKPGSKSYNDGMDEVKKIAKQRERGLINEGQIYGAKKVPLSTSED